MSILSKIVHAVIDRFEKVKAEVKEVVHDVVHDVKADVREAVQHIEEIKTHVEAAGERLAEAVIPHLAVLVRSDIDMRIARYAEANNGEQLDKNSVVDVFKAYGVESSFENRAQFAADFGIARYTGTAAQNDALRDRFSRWVRGYPVGDLADPAGAS